MTDRRKSHWLIALLMAFALFGAACAGGGEEPTEPGQDEGQEEEAVQGGTVVFGVEQEPSETLNGILAAGNLFWEAVLNNQVLEGVYEVQPDFSYEPELIESDPELTEDPFSITYTIREEAEWSDGEPITAEDMEFTLDTYMNKKWSVVSRAGYDKIEDVEITGDKTIKFTFSEPYAGWRDLFYRILPKHALEGENFNKVWTNGIINPKTGEGIASGPFMYEDENSYKPGQSLTMVRNDNYWKGAPNLDEIVFRFGLEETSSEIQALRGEEVHAIYPQPQLELTPLLNNPDFGVETNAGTTWEHIDFNYAHPLLGEEFVRKAIAFGIDREAIVQRLFSELAPDLVPLNNMIFLTNSPYYEEHFQDVDADPDAATQLLEDNGCTKGGDGIYECNGERLSFGYMSTAGNRLRELTFEVVQEQLRGVGIEVKSEFGDPAVVFGNKGLVGGNYDIFMFAWVGSPDPAGSVEIHKCEGAQNYQGYCNEEVTELLEQSNTIVDPEERAEVMNQADALMSEDLPILPMYQKPTFFAYTTSLQNAQDNPTSEGPTWNSEEWFLSDGGQ
jgi:peptide/nickel transport system substrate-binding protein